MYLNISLDRKKKKKKKFLNLFLLTPLMRHLNIQKYMIMTNLNLNETYLKSQIFLANKK